MLLKEILSSKGDSVLTTSPKMTLAEVVEKLVENRCGCLIVCEDDKMVGIISERDILRSISELAKPLDQILVESRMIKDVVTGSPSDEVNDVMGLLSKHRIRHLPVLEKGKLVGVISIGDVVKAQYDKLAMENQFMRDYIQS